jgi:Soluble lytic murein transglycosylase and related regulatory proteins (some contain LysM/invasin domains)
MQVRRSWVVAVVIPLVVLIAVMLVRPRKSRSREFVVPAKPEAPPDLEKLRPVFNAGLEAIRRGDGKEAVKQLSSFSFGNRAVSEYRLFYLANACQLAGDQTRARTTLLALWRRHPAFVLRAEAGSNLGGLYAAIGDWPHAAEVFGDVAAHADDSNVAASARWSAIESSFARGDVAAMLNASRAIAIRNPRAPQAAHAIELARSLSGLPAVAPMTLTEAERLECAVSLLRDGDPQSALDELSSLESGGLPTDLRMPVQLHRGLALNQLHRFDESSKVLVPLSSGAYRFAVPALFTAAQNYRALSQSVNPMVTKTTFVRQRVGFTKAGADGKRKPRFARVKKNSQLVDLAKKAKKDEYDRLATERLKDLLQLPLAGEVHIQVLNTLIATAEAKSQDSYEQELIAQLGKVDPLQEAGLQHFWDKAWAAYARGDLNGARALLAFIRDSYDGPNVKRQAKYWYARCGDRLGKKDEAAATYQELAAAPYDDIYAIESEKRGAKRPSSYVNPLTMNRPDWRDLAEQNMPQELRLGYELTALSDFRDAKQEIDKNRRRKNQPFADALLADLYHASGDTVLTLKTLRSAFPALATAEQDSVPPYFLKMYYPLKYDDWIREYSKKNNLNPYTIMALIHQESYFDAKAKSSVGATGLMQLMPATAKELAGRFHIAPRLDNPETNIRLGTAHFKMLANLFNSDELAIASYNAGQGRVMQWRRAAPGKPLDEFLESIPFHETRTYVKHVVMIASTYKRMYP